MGLAAPVGLQAAPTQVTVEDAKVLQSFDGLGCGAIFYEGHMTSLAARNKPEEQEKLYDAMFKDVRTDYLHLYIRHDHEPQNDNADPWTAGVQGRGLQILRAHAGDLQGGAAAAAADEILRHALHAAGVDENEQ